jgi:hypothetical protein
MSFGVPLLLSSNMSGDLLPRASMQSDSAQKYQECALQELIDRWPNILPISDFYSNVEGVCSLGREIPVPVGEATDCAIDNLLVTDDAHLVIIETKLWRNPQAVREVVAQALQYTMGLSQLSPDAFERCLRRGDPRSHRLGPDETVSQRVCEVLPERTDDFDDAFDRLRRNGDILLLIVGDGIRLSAERLVEWMNKAVGSAPYKLGLAELRFYDLPDGKRLVVPKSLLKISEASRHVVTINLQGTAREHVTATLMTPTELPETRKISVLTPPMSEDGLTAQNKGKEPSRGRETGRGATLSSQISSRNQNTRFPFVHKLRD